MNPNEKAVTPMKCKTKHKMYPKTFFITVFIDKHIKKKIHCGYVVAFIVMESLSRLSIMDDNSWDSAVLSKGNVNIVGDAGAAP